MYFQFKFAEYFLAEDNPFIQNILPQMINELMLEPND
ncbi:unnamed protein product [Tenebrio molitor]|nr:unnamed protein product [Tenebrio molitor]